MFPIKQTLRWTVYWLESLWFGEDVRLDRGRK